MSRPYRIDIHWTAPNAWRDDAGLPPQPETTTSFRINDAGQIEVSHLHDATPDRWEVMEPSAAEPLERVVIREAIDLLLTLYYARGPKAARDLAAELADIDTAEHAHID